MLEISLFGSFDLKRDGVSARTTWTRQAHRLLALLTLNHDRPVSTTWIIDALLIPDTVLPQSLGELYDTLGRDERGRLVNRNHQIHFNTDGITVDLFEFDRLIGRGTPECQVHAIKLHRGGLLKDWEEEGWFSEERENSLADYLEAINTLTKSALAEHNYELAASYLRRYVNAYPEMDAAWSRLVEVCAAAGNTLEIEQTRAKYLKSLEIRSAEQGRMLEPSQRFMQACAAAVSSPPGLGAGGPNPVGTQISAHDQGFPPHLTSPTEGRGIDARSVPTPNTQYPIPVSEPVGGAVPADSPFYIERAADKEALEALARRDSFILVMGPRQVGKSSLLARLIAAARVSGSQVVRTDWQKLPQSAMVTDRTFLFELAETFVDHLDIAASPSVYFESPRGAIACFEKFLKKQVLANVTAHLVWVVDEADRLFDQPYRDDVFAMLRSWHGERAADHTGRWQKITVIIAYATEAYLFITNMDQSPFNIGAKLELDDFTIGKVEELNFRYGSPLKTDGERDTLYDLIGGHPYLVRRALHTMCVDGVTVDALTVSTTTGDSVMFNDHLVRMKLALQRDPGTEDAVKQYLLNGTAPDERTFLRLRAAGVMRGNSAASMRPRCRLYDEYLRSVLLESSKRPGSGATD